MFTAERGLGAKCTIFEQGDLGPPPLNMGAGHCRGPMPRHLARALLAINASAPGLGITPAKVLDQRTHFRIVAGQGQRADVFVVMGDTTIRSFEGASVNDTLYAVWKPHAIGGGTSGDDTYARRVFRVTQNGNAQDVTASVMPSMVGLESHPTATAGADVAGPHLEDLSKLSLTSTTRWIIEHDPEQPLPANDPRGFDGGVYSHLTFVVWNGQRFVLQDRVMRAQWPCMPTTPDKPTCSRWPDAKDDRFITN